MLKIEIVKLTKENTPWKVGLNDKDMVTKEQKENYGKDKEGWKRVQDEQETKPKEIK